MSKATITPKQYLWPNGEWNNVPYKRTTPATGLLRMVRKFMFCWYMYDTVEVTQHITGNTVQKVEAHLKWQKKPTYAQNQPNNRIASGSGQIKTS